MQVGKVIREARKSCGMTQIELAKALGYDSSMFISLIEGEKSKLPPSKIKKVCRALKIEKKRLVDVMVTDYRKEISRHA